MQNGLGAFLRGETQLKTAQLGKYGCKGLLMFVSLAAECLGAWEQSKVEGSLDGC